MIDERYQVSAMPIEGGGRVTGYYCKRLMSGLKGPRQVDMIQVAVSPDHLRWVEVDPATIEPVRMRPEKCGNDFLCPNCNRVFWQPKHIPNDQLGEYCDMCGQRINWDTRLDDLVEG